MAKNDKFYLVGYHDENVKPSQGDAHLVIVEPIIPFLVIVSGDDRIPSQRPNSLPKLYSPLRLFVITLRSFIIAT